MGKKTKERRSLTMSKYKLTALIGCAFIVICGIFALILAINNPSVTDTSVISSDSPVSNEIAESSAVNDPKDDDVTVISKPVVQNNTNPVESAPPKKVKANNRTDIPIFVYEPDKSYLKTEITFPDKNFEKAVREKIKEPTDPITIADVHDVKELNLYDCKISDLTGIEYFSSLEFLNVSGNCLETIDVSSLKYLVKFACIAQHTEKEGDVSPLKSIKFGDQDYLTVINCSQNQIAELDLSGLPNLQSLNCNKNSIQKLDVTNNKKLYELFCSYNQIKFLDVSRCTETCKYYLDYDYTYHGLTRLECYNNPDIVVTGLDKLTDLCVYNGMSGEELANFISSK